jgi:peptide/nickel transport system permease protein
MLALGAMIGMLSTLPGLPGILFNGLINVFMLLPHLITLIVISAFIGHSAAELIILIALFGWVGTARNVRARVIHLNSQPFIESCTIQGFSRIHVIFHHILPNLYDLLLFRFLLGVNSCIMMESTLSFLGIGDVYTPTWGTMVNLAYKRGAFMRRAYNYLPPPGVCIMLLSLSFYFISMAVEARREQIDL